MTGVKMSYLRQSWMKSVIDYIGVICNDVRGHHACSRGSSYCGDDSECMETCIRRHFWLVALLHWRVLHRPSRRCCCCFEGRLFLKNGARHWVSIDEKKNCMHRHTIFRSYCCYYGRYYYRMTTVATIVARCRAPILFKKSHDFCP